MAGAAGFFINIMLETELDPPFDKFRNVIEMRYELGARYHFVHPVLQLTPFDRALFNQSDFSEDYLQSVMMDIPKAPLRL